MNKLLLLFLLLSFNTIKAQVIEELSGPSAAKTYFINPKVDYVYIFIIEINSLDELYFYGGVSENYLVPLSVKKLDNPDNGWLQKISNTSASNSKETNDGYIIYMPGSSFNVLHIKKDNGSGTIKYILEKVTKP